MTYATAIDLITRFGAAALAQRAVRGAPRLVTPQLLADAAASVDLAAAYTEAEIARAGEAMAVLQRALDDARDTIDSNISSRYTLPLSPVPSVLGRIACNLARFYLFSDQVTETIKDAYEDDLKLLQAIRDGKASLGVDAATDQAPASTASAEISTGGRVWSREKAGGFL